MCGISGGAAMDVAKVKNRMHEYALNARLVEWSREYGGSRYEAIGWSTGPHILAKLIEFGGFLPGSTAPRSMATLTPADEVERAVKRMAEGWPSHARILRCDYFQPGMAMDARLEMLRRAGVKVSKAGYYAKLESAKFYLAAILL